MGRDSGVVNHGAELPREPLGRGDVAKCPITVVITATTLTTSA